MKASDLNLEEILAHIESLSNEYWHDRFEVHDKRRQQKSSDLESLIVYLIGMAEEDILEYIYSFYGKYAQDGIVTSEVARVNMDSKEVLNLIEALNTILDRADRAGLKFDKDIEDDIRSLSKEKNVSRIDGLILKIKSRIELAYNDILASSEDHMESITQDAYLSTLYEVFYATGYGAKNKTRELNEDEIALLLALAWRATGEKYDDVIWRYKRTAENTIEQKARQNTDFGFSIDELLDVVNKTFKTDIRNLKTLIETDSTFYSTEAQAEGFEDLSIENALYCTIDDERRSEICTEADGNIIPVDEITPWVNAPPLHHNCRSWLVPFIQHVDYLTGEIYEVADETMDSWYDTWL